MEVEREQSSADQESDEIYEVILGHRRYACVKVGDVEVSVRIPLHIWEAKKYDLYTEYAESLAHKVIAEKRRQQVIEKKPASRLD